jgi:hypothetical protein
MIKKYDRFSKEDLAAANPVGIDNLRGLDLVQVPDITDDTLTPLRTNGGLMRDHIYNGRHTSPMLKSADIAMKRMYFGRILQGNHSRDDFEVSARARARYLGRAVAGRSVYVVAYEPADMVNNDHPGFFAAAVVGVAPFPEGGAMCVEPVVESFDGDRGLMPKDFYAVHGLYVPVQ